MVQDSKLARIQEIIDLLDPYLEQKLLPFWLENSVDETFGGFLTYFDRDGSRTEKTDKTLIMQLRMIFTLASAHRAGYGEGRCAEAARQGLDFVLDHFWDRDHGGWYWIADREGRILSDSKIMYGQSFGVYALAEYALAFDDRRAEDYACETFDLLENKAWDAHAGGYWEMFQRDWSLKPGGAYGGDRKTFDVHMHLMEAFTTLFELTRADRHRQKLDQVIAILTEKMLDPLSGTGIAQFDGSFNPLPAIIFRDVWGSDRPPHKEEARPLDNTNYGHNLEMAWLLKHTLDILEKGLDPYKPLIRKLVEQAWEWGLDREYGGVYVEGPPRGPAIQTSKEFWQQAEAMVGFLDAALIFEEDRYWEAFEIIFDFVWTRVINHEVGEWWALLDRDGTVRWDYLGHEWKISYHTVRAVIQTLQRLEESLGSHSA